MFPAKQKSLNTNNNRAEKNTKVFICLFLCMVSKETAMICESSKIMSRLCTQTHYSYVPVQTKTRRTEISFIWERGCQMK